MTSDWAAEEEATLGPDRLGSVGRWRDLIEAGVPTVGSTDFPVGHPRRAQRQVRAAMKALSDAATRVGTEAGPPPPWMADQALTVEQGLDLITRAGAYATFEEDRKGTVTTGKLADLVVLSEDPRAVAPADLPRRQRRDDDGRRARRVLRSRCWRDLLTAGRRRFGQPARPR